MSIDHIALNVQDLEGARAFFLHYFQGISGGEYHNHKSGLRTYFLTFGNQMRLELMHKPGLVALRPSPTQTGYIHLAFSVGSKEAVDRLTAQLAADGYEVICQPRTTGDGYYESCVRGFEDNLLEITV